MLLLTGLRIHYAGALSWPSYPTAVFLHDLLAAVFVLNAFLSLFYHVTTAEIRQFIPAGAGFLERMLVQARYYVQGIFQRAAHPLARTPQAKLNPLQQVTYLGLLNVLFPVQILTGVFMWVGGRWPEAVAPLGGLAVLAPVHNLGSWLFLSFLLMHVYLTTTGHTLTSNLRAMVDGWDEVETDTAAGAAAQRGGVKHA
jgi:thiosulfate reductase cytochrome b subunit